MQASLVMMVALSGLGCQNKLDSPIDTAAVLQYQSEAPVFSSDQFAGQSVGGFGSSFAATPYPEIASPLYAPNSGVHSGDWHAAIGFTLYSFVCGHDPGISTAREIEASVYGTPAGY